MEAELALAERQNAVLYPKAQTIYADQALERCDDDFVIPCRASAISQTTVYSQEQFVSGNRFAY
jgi:hypothetical protein